MSKAQATPKDPHSYVRAAGWRLWQNHLPTGILVSKERLLVLPSKLEQALESGTGPRF